MDDTKEQWVDEYHYSILTSEWENSKFGFKLLAIQMKGEQDDNENT
ncbi:hypothetical protein [Lysinibacillus cavernae]|nr:hypothetical protein [Lysinibacillus cavernae]